MKHVFIAIMVALSVTSFAQNRFTAPIVFDNSVNMTNALIFGGSEAASTHDYTITGKKSIIYVTTTRKDTIRLVSANYKTGQVFRMITTTAGNDSTLLLPSSGLVAGATSTWFAGATATYKSITLIFDGTNYYQMR